MKKAYVVVLSVLMCMSLAVFSTGCGKVPAMTPDQVVTLIETQLPGNLQLAASIAKLAGNPDMSKVLIKISNMAGTDLPIIRDAVNTWLANKTAGNLAALAAVTSSLASKINQQVLAANGLINSDADAIAMGVITGLSLIINGWAISLSNGGPAPVAKANLIVPEGFWEVMKITPRDEVEQVASQYGIQLSDFGM